jgi:hypothetical protein
MNLPTKPGLYLVQFHRRCAALVHIDGRIPFLSVKNVVDAYDLRPLEFSLIGTELYVEGELVAYAKLLEIERLI